ncbi:MAG TPA: hypothetical protein DCZ94_02670 [Lentisphaeria bacterium]|nr:MAG: hypothetical protein A2X48_08175 [Lentisphaerae bacterium GWF2_49_21]HBC85837.1 hypothetical protein [Lentisphaeria bacterium]
MTSVKLFASATISIAACSFCLAQDKPATVVEDAELTTVLPAVVSPSTVPAGSFFKLKLNWQAVKPLKSAYTVFIHYYDASGKRVFQGDHNPPVGTGTPGWIGGVSYENRVVTPVNLADGTYRIVIGLYIKDRLALKVGQGVKDLGEKNYDVGSFTIDKNAPWTKGDTEKAATLKLDGFKMTFSEEFDKPLDVSAWGPGTRWICHTPWNGDFGDARFTDPGDDFSCKVEKGILYIEARKDEAFKAKDQWKRPWKSGLLCSNDPKGNGFSQQYGYFEMRAKMPKGPGVWPAFWLSSSFDRKNPKGGETGCVEIDIIEYYGHAPNSYTATMHVWEPKPHWGEGTSIMTKPDEASSGFHNYGCMVEPDFTTMYFDGIEVWKTKTPKEHNKPLMILLNLALGSGWPIDKTPNPSVMEVDYVRAYAK